MAEQRRSSIAEPESQQAPSLQDEEQNASAKQASPPPPHQQRAEQDHHQHPPAAPQFVPAASQMEHRRPKGIEDEGMPRKAPPPKLPYARPRANSSEHPPQAEQRAARTSQDPEQDTWKDKRVPRDKSRRFTWFAQHQANKDTSYHEGQSEEQKKEWSNWPKRQEKWKEGSSKDKWENDEGSHETTPQHKSWWGWWEPQDEQWWPKKRNKTAQSSANPDTAPWQPNEAASQPTGMAYDGGKNPRDKKKGKGATHRKEVTKPKKGESALHPNTSLKENRQKVVAKDDRARPAPNGVKPSTGTKRNNPARKDGTHPLLQHQALHTPIGRGNARKAPTKDWRRPRTGFQSSRNPCFRMGRISAIRRVAFLPNRPNISTMT